MLDYRCVVLHKNVNLTFLRTYVTQENIVISNCVTMLSVFY